MTLRTDNGGTSRAAGWIDVPSVLPVAEALDQHRRPATLGYRLRMKRDSAHGLFRQARDVDTMILPQLPQSARSK